MQETNCSVSARVLIIGQMMPSAPASSAFMMSPGDAAATARQVDGVCPLAMGGLNLYRDRSHLNRDFNETLAPLIAADLAGARLIRTE
jgi:hypothetical protein